jgi:hypothetical protein
LVRTNVVRCHRFLQGSMGTSQEVQDPYIH